MDVLNGWDISDDKTFAKVLTIIHDTRPLLTFISPPCTIFSKMQVRYDHKLRIARIYVFLTSATV